MILYERIEDNNFDEIDKNRAIELIEGGNGHLVYNEDYFKLQKENEELKYKIKGQECVIETQVHNEEVYESIFEKLEKENKELKKQVKSDVNTIYNNYLEKLDEYERNTIQIQRIKDKIEQLEKNELFGKYNFEQIKFAVDALQELLEGRK